MEWSSHTDPSLPLRLKSQCPFSERPLDPPSQEVPGTPVPYTPHTPLPTHSLAEAILLPVCPREQAPVCCGNQPEPSTVMGRGWWVQSCSVTMEESWGSSRWRGLAGERVHLLMEGSRISHAVGKGPVGRRQAALAEMEQSLEGGSWAAEGRELQSRAATVTGRKEGQGGVDTGSLRFVSRKVELFMFDCRNYSVSCYLGASVLSLTPTSRNRWPCPQLHPRPLCGCTCPRALIDLHTHIRTPMHTLMHRLTHSQTQLIDSHTLTYTPTHRLTHSQTCTLTRRLTHSLTHTHTFTHVHGSSPLISVL